jgi:hypothetical protein
MNDQAKKIDKALYGPSTWEVALGAFLGFLVGLFAACVYLAFKPVKVVSEAPKDKVAGMVYLIQGASSSAKAKGVASKEKRFLAGGSVELVEDELNVWAANLGKPAAPPPAKGGAPGAKPAAEGTGASLTAGPPNFRIRGGMMQIGYKCTANYFGVTFDFMVMTTGKFAKSGEEFVFEPDAFYLGSCPLHKLFGLGAPVIHKLAQLHPVSDELKTAWARLSDIQIEDQNLKLMVN